MFASLYICGFYLNFVLCVVLFLVTELCVVLFLAFSNLLFSD